MLLLLAPPISIGNTTFTLSDELIANPTPDPCLKLLPELLICLVFCTAPLVLKETRIVLVLFWLPAQIIVSSEAITTSLKQVSSSTSYGCGSYTKYHPSDLPPAPKPKLLAEAAPNVESMGINSSYANCVSAAKTVNVASAVLIIVNE